MTTTNDPNVCKQLDELRAFATDNGWEVQRVPTGDVPDTLATDSAVFTEHQAGRDLAVIVAYGRSARTGRWGLLQADGHAVNGIVSNGEAEVTFWLTSVKEFRKMLTDCYDYMQTWDATADWLPKCLHAFVEHDLHPDCNDAWCSVCGAPVSVSGA